MAEGGDRCGDAAHGECARLSLGLDDDQRLIDELQRATGLVWRDETAEANEHLDGGIAEIVLVAVLGKTTELAYSAVEKVRTHVEQWRREGLDAPDYSLAEEIVADSSESLEGADGEVARPQDPAPGG